MNLTGRSRLNNATVTNPDTHPEIEARYAARALSNISCDDGVLTTADAPSILVELVRRIAERNDDACLTVRQLPDEAIEPFAMTDARMSRHLLRKSDRNDSRFSCCASVTTEPGRSESPPPPPG